MGGDADGQEIGAVEHAQVAELIRVVISTAVNPAVTRSATGIRANSSRRGRWTLLRLPALGVGPDFFLAAGGRAAGQALRGPQLDVVDEVAGVYPAPKRVSGDRPLAILGEGALLYGDGVLLGVKADSSGSGYGVPGRARPRPGCRCRGNRPSGRRRNPPPNTTIAARAATAQPRIRRLRRGAGIGPRPRSRRWRPHPLAGQARLLGGAGDQRGALLSLLRLGVRETEGDGGDVVAPATAVGGLDEPVDGAPQAPRLGRIRRISSSETIVVRPSLQSRKTSPSRAGKVMVSTFTLGSGPRAR